MYSAMLETNPGGADRGHASRRGAGDPDLALESAARSRVARAGFMRELVVDDVDATGGGAIDVPEQRARAGRRRPAGRALAMFSGRACCRTSSRRRIRATTRSPGICTKPRAGVRSRRSGKDSKLVRPELRVDLVAHQASAGIHPREIRHLAESDAPVERVAQAAEGDLAFAPDDELDRERRQDVAVEERRMDPSTDDRHVGPAMPHLPDRVESGWPGHRGGADAHQLALIEIGFERRRDRVPRRIRSATTTSCPCASRIAARL